MICQYPFTCLLVVVIWVLCLMPIPETPLSHVSMIDKWTHLVMYGTLCLVVWWEHGRLKLRASGSSGRTALPTWVVVWLLPVVMSAVIELAQHYCTGGMRSGEWLDFAANTLGATLVQPIGYGWYRWRSRS